jgi:hypothetical protein
MFQPVGSMQQPVHAAVPQPAMMIMAPQEVQLLHGGPPQQQQQHMYSL